MKQESVQIKIERLKPKTSGVPKISWKDFKSTLNSWTSQNRWPSCNQCGYCCQLFTIDLSPEELNKHDDPEATKIKKMLVGRYHGPTSDNRHLYGPCKNLAEDGFTCKVYHDRPNMCRGFPYYSRPAITKEGGGDTDSFLKREALPLENPSDYRGCTFNLNLTKGRTLLQFKQTLKT